VFTCEHYLVIIIIIIIIAYSLTYLLLPSVDTMGELVFNYFRKM